MSLKEVATRILSLIEAGEYQSSFNAVKFRDEQARAQNNTRLYTPEQIEDIRAYKGSMPTIRVVDGTTQEIAHQMAVTANSHLALLNFASARNPGGGFLNGAKAQEEDLCRCSGLYPCLLKCPEYYQVNRAQSSMLYTDYSIFSPHVPFFKTSGTGNLLGVPFFVSVITSPAPNSGPFLKDNPDGLSQLRETFFRRWSNVLRIAHHQGVGRLILGAWGCGAFQGDPIVAAETAQQAIQAYGGGFEEIVFAIPGDGRRSGTNLKAFQAMFG